MTMYVYTLYEFAKENRVIYVNLFAKRLCKVYSKQCNIGVNG